MNIYIYANLCGQSSLQGALLRGVGLVVLSYVKNPCQGDGIIPAKAMVQVGGLSHEATHDRFTPKGREISRKLNFQGNLGG